MDKRLRNFNIFLAGACIGLTLYSASHDADRVASVLWAACTLSFLAAAHRI